MSRLLAAITLKPEDIGLPTSTSSVTDIITRTTKLLAAVIGLLSVVFIIIGSLQMVSSAGNPSNFARGREAVMYAVVGVVVAISAYALVAFISGSLAI